jgi:hypothetical protein
MLSYTASVAVVCEFRYRGLIFQTPAMGFIMPMPWLDRPVFESFGPHFVLTAQGLAAELGAAMGACFAGRLLLPYLAHKCAHTPLTRDRAMFAGA